MFFSPGREHKEARSPPHGCDIMREPRKEEISPSSKGQAEAGGGGRGCKGGGRKGPLKPVWAAGSAAPVAALTAERPPKWGLKI